MFQVEDKDVQDQRRLRKEILHDSKVEIMNASQGGKFRRKSEGEGM